MKIRKTLFEGAHDAMKMYTICTKAMTSKKKKTRKTKQKGIANKSIKTIKQNYENY